MNELAKWLEQNGQEALARELRITQGAVSQWLAKGQVPLNRVRGVERVTGIPASTLRPDVFGDTAA